MNVSEQKISAGTRTTGTPKISVVVPVYNVEKYLRECVDSVLAQTFADFELILVDDGSLDDSGKICDEYAKKDSRVRVFHKANGGVSSARNLGIKESRADYLAFLDSDDWWNLRFLEKMHALAEKFPNAGCCCCGWFNNVSEDGKTVGQPALLPDYELGATVEINLVDYAVKNGGTLPIWTGAVLLKKDAVVRAGGFNENLVNYEDYALWIPVCLRDGSASAFRNEALSFYRKTPFANKPRGRLPDLRKHWVAHLDSFDEAEKTNASLKRFLDIFRQKTLIPYREIPADSQIVEKTLAQISRENWDWKFWLVYHLPHFLGTFLLRANAIKSWLKGRLANLFSAKF